MAKEIEILWALNEDIELSKKKLSTTQFLGSYAVNDLYFYDPLRSQLKPSTDNELAACLRVRQKNNRQFVTHKIDHFHDGTWSHSDESETFIGSAEVMIDIFKKLGLKELIRVEVIRHFYHYGNYEITLEEVNKLGNFIEIEYKLSDDDVNVDTIKAEIRSTVESLGIATGEEQQAGKPELLLRATQGQDEIDT